MVKTFFQPSKQTENKKDVYQRLAKLCDEFETNATEFKILQNQSEELDKKQNKINSINNIYSDPAKCNYR